MYANSMPQFMELNVIKLKKKSFLHWYKGNIGNEIIIRTLFNRCDFFIFAKNHSINIFPVTIGNNILAGQCSNEVIFFHFINL